MVTKETPDLTSFVVVINTGCLMRVVGRGDVDLKVTDLTAFVLLDIKNSIVLVGHPELVL